MFSKGKFIVFVVLLTMFMQLMMVQAYAEANWDEEGIASKLSALDMFRGTGSGFELERAPTRAEAAAMFVRLLGKEQEALNNNFHHPFTDVPLWANPYVGYMYQAKLTTGIGNNLFGSLKLTDANMYTTFILRALGYDDRYGDFEWNKSVDKAIMVNLLVEEDRSQLLEFQRGDLAVLSYKALQTDSVISKLPLISDLVNSGAVSLEATKQVGLSSFVTVSRLMEPVEISEVASETVVYIEVFDKEMKNIGNGSGFIISEDGQIATNFHVIMNAYHVEVRRIDGQRHDVTHILGYDAIKDIAILKIDANELSFMKLGDSSKLKNGEKVVTIGSPIGLENTISDGIVSNTNRLINEQHFIQITAPISPGSSGGALFNLKAEVIGITTGFYVSGQNLNLAIPINELKNVLLLEQKLTMSELMTQTIILQLSDKDGVYLGEAIAGIPHGKGKYTYYDGNQFEGEFNKGIPTGSGKATTSEGDVTLSEWKDGYMHGKVKVIFSDGIIFEGNMQYGELVGEATYYYTDGTIGSGRWLNDTFIPKEVEESIGTLSLYSDEPNRVYLGKLTTNEADSVGIFNESNTFGNADNDLSIWGYGKYGDYESEYSPYNEEASNPPLIINSNGEIVGVLTVNTLVKGAVDPDYLYDILLELDR